MARNFESIIRGSEIEEVFTPVSDPRPLEFDEPRNEAAALRRRLLGRAAGEA
jgi:hypothetical protein